MGATADRADRHSKHHRLVLARSAQRDELRPRFVRIVLFTDPSDSLLEKVWLSGACGLWNPRSHAAVPYRGHIHLRLLTPRHHIPGIGNRKRRQIFIAENRFPFGRVTISGNSPMPYSMNIVLRVNLWTPENGFDDEGECSGFLMTLGGETNRNQMSFR